jgi:hypothetical protein
VEIALPFWDTCLKGLSCKIDQSDLIKSFLEFVPDTDKGTLQNALSDFESVSVEDLMEALEPYSVRVVSSKSNIHDVVAEVAHRELVQAPAYVAECWQDILNSLMPKTDIRQMFAELTPTSKKVLALLDVPSNLTLSQTATADFLRKYVRGLSLDLLKKFLRFVTG